VAVQVSAVRTGQCGSACCIRIFKLTQTSPGTDQCTSQSQNAARDSSNWFQVFNCTSKNGLCRRISTIPHRYISKPFIDTYFGDATYNITIHSTNGTSLNAVRLPDVWLSNFADTLQDPPASQDSANMSNFAPWLVPPWRLIVGSHVEASVGLAERRFITSSMLRDIVVNLKPVCQTLAGPFWCLTKLYV
jgi:hypothetical protein